MRGNTNEPIKEPELALWRAVILQAFRDANDFVPEFVGPPLKKKGQGKKGTKQPQHLKRAKEQARFYRNLALDRDTARAWLLTDDEDFPRVCHMAQMDPGAVRDSARECEAGGWNSSDWFIDF